MGPHRQQRAVDLDASFGFFDVRVFLDHLRHDLFQPHRLEFDLIAAQPAVAQDGLDELVQAIARFNDPGEQVAAVRAELLAVILQHHLGQALNGAQRSAQVMGDGVGKRFEFG